MLRFSGQVLNDTYVTRDLVLNDRMIRAEDVHATFMVKWPPRIGHFAKVH